MNARYRHAILIVIGLIQLVLPHASHAMTAPAPRTEEPSAIYALRPQSPAAHELAGGGTIAALKCPTIYVVRYGETLYSIAARCGTTAAVLMRANGLRTARVWPGQRLYIPAPKSVPAPQPTPSIHRRPAP